MPGGEVAPGRAEHDDAPAGHVLAAVVADALDDGVRARVAHREALAGQPAEERAAARRAVEDGVADDDVLLGGEGRRPRAACTASVPPRQALARVVVGVAVQREASRPAPASRRRTGRPSREVDLDRVRAAAPRRRGRWAIAAREHAADAAVDVADVGRRSATGSLARRPRGAACSSSSQSRWSSSTGGGGSMRRRGAPSGSSGQCEDVREVDAARLPVLDRLVGLEQVGAADQLVERAHAERGHDPAQLLGHEEEEVDDVLGLCP